MELFRYRLRRSYRYRKWPHQHHEIADAVSHSKDYGIYFHSGSFVSFSNNNFTVNNGYAVTLMMEQAGAIDGNTTFSENGWDGVAINNSAMTEAATWAALGRAMHETAQQDGFMLRQVLLCILVWKLPLMKMKH
ncbi:MAG: right-handed parallel beta-helix repeat-containing protein [Bacteroidales bacterium]|nr:right-handed parallel beta-helix repeat-containing protein [Bacteroidales bacterium]